MVQLNDPSCNGSINIDPSDLYDIVRSSRDSRKINLQWGIKSVAILGMKPLSSGTVFVAFLSF